MDFQILLECSGVNVCFRLLVKAQVKDLGLYSLAIDNTITTQESCNYQCKKIIQDSVPRNNISEETQPSRKADK